MTARTQLLKHLNSKYFKAVTKPYFLAYAYSWMVNRRDESKINQIMTDVHAPEQFRVNGPLSNIPEFHKAFNVKKGDKMYQPDSLRVVIW